VELEEKQIEYTALDAYAQMICFLELDNIPYVDPKEVLQPKEPVEGDRVLLYTQNLLAVVAEMTFQGPSKTITPFGHEITKRGFSEIQLTDIQRPAAITPKKNTETTLEDVGVNEIMSWPLSKICLQLTPFIHAFKLNTVWKKAPEPAGTDEDENIDIKMPALEPPDEDSSDPSANEYDKIIEDYKSPVKKPLDTHTK